MPTQSAEINASNQRRDGPSSLEATPTGTIIDGGRLLSQRTCDSESHRLFRRRWFAVPLRPRHVDTPYTKKHDQLQPNQLALLRSIYKQ